MYINSIGLSVRACANKFAFKGFGSDDNNDTPIPRSTLRQIYTMDYMINRDRPTAFSDMITIGHRIARRNVNVDINEHRNEIIIEENYMFDDDNNN